MKKFDLPMISDALFYGFCAFVLSVAVLRYFRAPLWLAISAGAALGLAIGALSMLLIYGKNRKKLLSKREREARDALMLHLALEKPERVRAALLEAFLADGKNAHCFEEELLIDERPCVPVFSLEPVSADEIARLIRRFGNGKFALACNDASREAEKLLQSFGIEKIGADEIYALFSRTKKYPERLICGEVEKWTAKRKLKRTFSKSNARPFFVSGILLLAMSLFTFFPVYYIIAGSVLIFCAITVRLFGYAA